MSFYRAPARPEVGPYLALLLLTITSAFAAAPWVKEQPASNAFPLFDGRIVATIVTAPEEFEVVQVASRDLSADINRVTGRSAELKSSADNVKSPAILVGTLGKSPLIDDLVARKKIDVTELRGAWESFIITTVEAPSPGIAQALVIVGSDRRGTAFGVYELSQAIGVSPWYWWADVTPSKKSALYVDAGTRRFGPPSVQYRGIFLNDEDWGLQPWAAKTFEPEVGDIGPKTYAKICELLLRLKANTLWPAMHACTQAFNHYPENKLVAHRYAIVMGSSHAEPMLRNNVTEWTAPHEDYNYIKNREGVRSYWEQRVKENGKFENIYTLGMRGIHDSNMQGAKTDAERIATLEKIFADQRAMIAKHVSPHVEQVPQMFCAYKEVLDLYRQGLQVPDDVTIVWPDDNFGYIRNFATPEEQKRSGGFGVYYHISYLGRPLSYLWLNTTPPALIWSEMHKAYEHGARKLWIVNVGDLKPGEIGTEFFLQMAWDINRWKADNIDKFLSEWAAREFGEANAQNIGFLMSAYYRFNFQRRPEHLQWWLSREAPQPSPFPKQEAGDRILSMGHLAMMADHVRASLPPDKQAAFTQLVNYPVRGSMLANGRYFSGEFGEKERATKFDHELKELTHSFNEELSSGKWRGFMALEPANDEWKSMRIAPWKMPEFPPKPEDTTKTEKISITEFRPAASTSGVHWKPLPGLGYTLLPTTASSFDRAKLKTHAPQISAPLTLAVGTYEVTVQLLPTHPLVTGLGLSVGLAVNDAEPTVLTYSGKDGSAEWAQGVLNNYVTVSTTIRVPSAGEHTLRLYSIDAGVVVRKIELTPATIATDTSHATP
ncbi:glycosyl hydrolase 115 family protein [Oleiharenicola lentus]|uniref:glycosyl hydrolase 115 family protein n=1 Tax=Oleiharenicola lentus TaxID=2508720 RepID=UPI003F6673ED